MKKEELIDVIEKNCLCVVPPNEETKDWTVFSDFDEQFGYDREIGSGKTLADALEMAAATLASD